MTTEETETPSYFNEQLHILLIGLLAGFACGFFIRSYDGQEQDYSKLDVEEKYITSFEEEENETSEDTDEGKWSLIPTEDDGTIENYSQGFDYKKEW